MDQDQKRTYLSWGMSFGIHCLIVVALAVSGVFSYLRQAQDPPVAVEIYDADAGGSEASAGAGSEASVDTPVDVVEDTIPDPATPPENQNEQEQKPPQADTDTSRHTSEGHTGNSGQTEGNGHGSGSGTGEGTGTGTGDGVGHGGDAKRPKTPPAYLSGSMPVYPEALRKQGVQGTVVLSLLVGADGSVQEASVASSSGYSELDQAALAVAYSYQFTPATNSQDEPVPCRVSWPVAFHF